MVDGLEGITLFLAIWGALLSTATMGWNLYRDLTDRAKLKVDASIGNLVPDPTKRDYLFLTITNVGKRPVLVKTWAMKFKSQEKPYGIIIADRLPRLLKESEYETLWTPEISHLTADVERMYVVDSGGKEWRVSRRQLKRTLKEAGEVLRR